MPEARLDKNEQLDRKIDNFESHARLERHCCMAMCNRMHVFVFVYV